MKSGVLLIQEFRKNGHFSNVLEDTGIGRTFFTQSNSLEEVDV